MSNDNTGAEHLTEYVTVMIGGQLFGLPISRVQDVFMPDRITRVPLSAPEIAAYLICAAASSRRSTCAAGSACPAHRRQPLMAVGIELKANPTGC